MALTIATVKHDFSQGNTTTLTPDLGSTPASGNLLVSALTTLSGTDPGTITPPSGFTEINSWGGDSNPYVYLYYKKSDGTEQTAAWSWASTAKATVSYWEISGADADAPDSEDAEANSGGSTVTSQATGTLASAPTAAHDIIVWCFTDSAGRTDAGRSWADATFSEATWHPVAQNARPGVSMAFGEGADADTSATFTTTDTGDAMRGVIWEVNLPSLAGLSAGTLALMGVGI
jgi:hypothetical protein